MKGTSIPGSSLTEIAGAFQAVTRFVYDKLVKILKRAFYQRHPAVVARELLGKILVRKLNGKTLSGRIVETEAYSSDDPASHAYHGLTESNRALFGEPGHAYIYFTYGMHFCLNIVARRGKPAGGVLIRALEPLEGIDQMKRRRNSESLRNLMSGPGKITQALKIDKTLYGADLTRRGAMFITDEGDARFQTVRTPRIGIGSAREKLWRFVVQGNRYVSRPPRPRGARSIFR